MSESKHFTLYTHDRGPNGWKVVMVLHELGLSYESVYLDFGKREQKAPVFLKTNPNGRIPALVDHQNGDFTLWESNAIILYLIEKYDVEKKVSASSEGDKFLQLQWLFFQASGQGPYFGQMAWFISGQHPENVPSAVDRYKNETLRVLGVLESVLSRQEWLVGDKCTVSDLSFIPWNELLSSYLFKNNEGDVKAQFPAFLAWHNKMLARPAITEVVRIQATMRDKKG